MRCSWVHSFFGFGLVVLLCVVILLWAESVNVVVRDVVEVAVVEGVGVGVGGLERELLFDRELDPLALAELEGVGLHGDLVVDDLQDHVLAVDVDEQEEEPEPFVGDDGLGVLDLPDHDFLLHLLHHLGLGFLLGVGALGVDLFHDLREEEGEK